MDEIILEFLKAYKKLDELCKQVLGSDRGISEYIDQMQSEGKGCSKVPNWDNDLKEVKRLRWMRNRLVHDADSFDMLTVTNEDISYLKEFRSRILSCEDPFALLRNSKKPSKHSNISARVEGPAFVYDEEDYIVKKSNDTKIQQNSMVKVFFAVIVFLALIFFFEFFLS